MEFNQEDQKWIIAARKDLEADQIAKILKVNVNDVISFLDTLKAQKIKKARVYNANRDLKKVVNKRFIKNQIKNRISLNDTAKELGLSNYHQLIWILRVNKLSWREIRKEVLQELKVKIIKINITVKKCGKCQNIKHFSLFYKDSKSSTGYTSWCKQCHQVYDSSKKFKLKSSKV